MIASADMTPEEQRFWALVDIQYTAGIPDFEACWPWKGCRTRPSTRHKDHPGYGQFRVGAKRVKAHRHAWELWHGVLMPTGLDAAHVVCDNPPCCNPTHVGPEDHWENWKSFIESYGSCHGRGSHKERSNGKHHARRAHA